jgi:hypothetical protein
LILALVIFVEPENERNSVWVSMALACIWLVVL